MPFTSIVVGIDSSPAALAAARAGWELAARNGGTCHFVHATYDVSEIPAVLPPDVDVDSLADRVSQAEEAKAVRVLTEAIGGVDPAALTVQVGTPRWVLQQVAEEREADLVMVGGKRHVALARWLGGSTAHHLIQMLDRPVLVVHPDRPLGGRIMAALDLSPHSGQILELAAALAESLDGTLRVVHAVEPLPVTSSQAAVFNHAAFVEWAELEFAETVRAAPGDPDSSLQRGPPDEVIGRECEAWRPDILVIGSHGKGLVDRMLLGSTAHRLLTDLPTSLLVVPVGASAGGEGAEDAQAAQGAATR